MRQSNKSLGMKISAFVLAFAMVLTLVGTANVSALAADDDSSAVETVSVNRAYNPNNGEHLLTVDKAEYDYNVGLGLNAEGEKWLAPVKSNTPLYRVYNPNSGEHLLIADKGEYDSVVASGWNGEDLKMYSDDNKGVAIYRVFNPNATDAGSHLYAEKEEADYLVSIGWNLENNGQPVIYGVAAKYSSDVELIDLNGFQSDGTAKVGDTLQVRFGSELGVPSKVVWYKDGAVVKVSAEDISTDDLQLKLNANSGTGVGVYYVQVENTKGKIEKTQSVTVVEDGVVSITNVSIADYTEEYGTGYYQTFAEVDTSAVITMDINKVYTDAVIVLAETEKLAQQDLGAITSVYPVAMLKNAKSSSEVQVAKKLTDREALDASTSSSMMTYYKHPDGHYTVKLTTRDFGSGQQGLTRGKSYTVITTDKTTLEKALDTKTMPSLDALQFTGQSFTVPYLPAPKALGTSVQTIGKTNVAVLTYYADETMTTPLKFLGSSTVAVTSTTVGINTPTVVQVKDNNGSVVSQMKSASGGMINAGVTEAFYGDTGDSVVGIVASVKIPKGIYGKDDIELTSGVQALNAKSLNEVSFEYDEINSPNDLTVNLTGLMTNGTLALIRSKSSSTIKADVAAVSSLSAQPVATKTVTKGTASTTFDGVIDKIYNGTTDVYHVAFIPNNTSEFASYSSGLNEKMEVITAKPVSLKLNSAVSGKTLGAITGDAVKVTAIDQFGNEISSFPTGAQCTLSEMTYVGPSATHAAIQMTVTESAIKVTGSSLSVAVPRNATWTYVTNFGQKIILTPENANGTDTPAAVTFKITLE